MKKGFTLIEMMIAMLVSSIVISTAYFAWAKFFELGLKSRENDLHTLEIQTLHRLLERKWNTAREGIFLNEERFLWKNALGNVDSLHWTDSTLFLNGKTLLNREELQIELKPKSLPFGQGSALEQYDFNGDGMLDETELDLNSDNLWDRSELKYTAYLEFKIFSHTTEIYSSGSLLGLQGPLH